MQVQKIQNNNLSFSAGSVNLRKIKAKNILQYDAIEKIAEENSLDIFIKKLKDSKYFPNRNFYIVYSKQEVDTTHKALRGTSSVIVSKYAKITETSAKIYDAVLKSIEKLNSKKQTL